MNRWEVPNSVPFSLAQAVVGAFNVDNALYGAGMFNIFGLYTYNSGLQPTELGSKERRGHYRQGRSINDF